MIANGTYSKNMLNYGNIEVYIQMKNSSALQDFKAPILTDSYFDGKFETFGF